MKYMRLALLTLLLMCSLSCKDKEDKKMVSLPISETSLSDQRIITISGGITEIVAALGQEKNIVGTDVTSTYPESLKNTAKDLGHVRSMTIEPIMALQPTLLLASDKDINPELLKSIKSSGLNTKLFHQEFTVDGTKKLIEQVAKSLDNNQYQHIIDKIDEDLKQLKPITQKTKVLFIYARGNMLMVAGKNTPMTNLIEIAGGENAANEFEDFKPLTPEAVIAANPDVIMMFSSGLHVSGGEHGVLQMPGVAQTNAGKNKKIIAMDGGLVSSFGPRLGQAALELNKLLVESTK